MVYDYKEKKEKEIKQLTQQQDKFKKEIEKNKKDYDKIVEDTTAQIEDFVEKANLENPIQ